MLALYSCRGALDSSLATVHNLWHMLTHLRDSALQSVGNVKLSWGGSTKSGIAQPGRLRRSALEHSGVSQPAQRPQQTDAPSVVGASDSSETAAVHSIVGLPLVSLDFDLQCYPGVMGGKTVASWAEVIADFTRSIRKCIKGN